MTELFILGLGIAVGLYVHKLDFRKKVNETVSTAYTRIKAELTGDAVTETKTEKTKTPQ